ncbi:MAG: hypothetical protein J3R72DRAFT_504532 [Linnemannia gamsii]|nr:MAG: hypothetical protein J3R72DRAFT_504532 [Linnemannia gamsii]
MGFSSQRAILKHRRVFVVHRTQSEAHTGDHQHSEVSIAGVDNAETRPNENEHPIDAFPGPILTVVEQIDITIEEFRMYIRSGSDGLRNTIVIALHNLRCGGDDGYEGGGAGGQPPSVNDATAATAGTPDDVVQGLVMNATCSRTRSVEEMTEAPALAPAPAARPLLPIESPFAAPIHVCAGGTGGAQPLFGNDFVVAAAAAVTRVLGGGAQETAIARTSAAAENSSAVVEAPTRSRAFLPIESPFAARFRPCIKSPHVADVPPLNFNVAAAIHAVATAEVRNGVTNQRTLSSEMGRRTENSTVVVEAPICTRAFLLIESPFADNTHPLNPNSPATATVANTSPNPTTPPAAPRSPTHQQRQHQKQQPIIDSPSSTDFLTNSPTLSAINFPYSNSRINNLPELRPQDSWTGRIRAQQKQWCQRQAQICHQADMQFKVGQSSGGGGDSGGVGRSGFTARDGGSSTTSRDQHQRQSLTQLECPYRLPPQQEAHQLDEKPQEQADITNDTNDTEADLPSSPSKRKRLGVDGSFEEDDSNTAEEIEQGKEVRRQKKRKEEMISTVLDALSTPTSNEHRGGETCREHRKSRASY